MGKGAAADGKPKGRMSSYAYFVQTSREEGKKKRPEEKVVFADFSKQCADQWKTMTDKDKNRFHQMAEKDKNRYEGEMSHYKPAKGDKGGKKRKQVKDPNAPKRSLSAFFWFSNTERPKVRETMADATVGEVAKVLGRKWNELGPDAKRKFEALAAKDKARYEKELDAYKSKKPKVGSPSKQKVVATGGDSDDGEEEDDDEEEEDDEDEDD